MKKLLSTIGGCLVAFIAILVAGCNLPPLQHPVPPVKLMNDNNPFTFDGQSFSAEVSDEYATLHAELHTKRLSHNGANIDTWTPEDRADFKLGVRREVEIRDSAK